MTGSDSALVRRYAGAMALQPRHTVLFFAASLGLTCWILTLLVFGFGPPPLWAFAVAFPPLLLWVVVVLPRHYRVVYLEPGFRKLLFRPLLMARCGAAALRPGPEDSAQRPWLLWLYYLSLALPAGGLLLTLGVALGRSWGS